MTLMDKVLLFFAAVVGALAVYDPIGLPHWVQGVAVILTIGFAAIGINAPARTVNRE